MDHILNRRFPISFTTIRKLAHAAMTLADRHLTTTAMCVLSTYYARRRATICRKCGDGSRHQ